MLLHEFEKCFDARVDLCRRVLIGKNAEYSRGNDKLHNFNKASHITGDTPEACLSGMMLKHYISIDDMIDDLNRGQHHHMAQWEEKIGDLLNYLFLLRALLSERYEGRQAC